MYGFKHTKYYALWNSLIKTPAGQCAFGVLLSIGILTLMVIFNYYYVIPKYEGNYSVNDKKVLSAAILLFELAIFIIIGLCCHCCFINLQISYNIIETDMQKFELEQVIIAEKDL
jgi:riboflavin transporter FmnP